MLLSRYRGPSAANARVLYVALAWTWGGAQSCGWYWWGSRISWDRFRFMFGVARLLVFSIVIQISGLSYRCLYIILIIAGSWRYRIQSGGTVWGDLMVCCGVRFFGFVFGNDPRGCRVCVSFPRFQWVFSVVVGRQGGSFRSRLFLFFWEDFSCSPSPRIPLGLVEGMSRLRFCFISGSRKEVDCLV